MQLLYLALGLREDSSEARRPELRRISRGLEMGEDCLNQSPRIRRPPNLASSLEASDPGLGQVVVTTTVDCFPSLNQDIG